MQRIYSNGGIKRNLLGMVFILAIMLATSANTMAQQTWTVGANGQNFATIQDAIDSSTVEVGDTIIVVDSAHDEPSDINVTKNLTIKGAEGLNPIVDERFIIPSSSVVSIQDLTIDHEEVAFVGSGGGIHNSGELTLTGCTVSGNSTDYFGGGIYNTGTATLTNCTVSGNSTTYNSGGGIYSAGTGTLTLANCMVSGNSAANKGGGIYASGTATLTGCDVIGNNATDADSSPINGGGGIYSAGTLTLTSCTVSGNTAKDGLDGGGIYAVSYEVLTFTNCTVSGNIAREGLGGGIYFRAGYTADTVTFINCTVSGNTATAAGGIYNDERTLALINCTVSGNTATASNGGGIYNDWRGPVMLTNCTVSGNNAGGSGGGMYFYSPPSGESGTAELKNTIFANNAAVHGPDIYSSVSGSVSANYCLIEDDTDVDITGSYNIIGQDPALGSLAPNDTLNETWTHALLVGSPAIDAGTGVDAPATDQRGFARVGSVDMGAYEYQDAGTDTDPPIVSNVVADPNPVAVNTAISLTATVDDSGTGGSDIVSAEYSIDGDVTWVGMNGAFVGVTEDVTATIPAFSVAGVHTICVRRTDASGNVSVGECILLAVYDPEGGFVTGGGWILSPEGAYAPDPLLTGKANFGFVSKYKKGADTPTGQTEFQFKVASLNFHSSSYDWLVVAGHKAQYKGDGTINNAGNYGFMLTAIDADLTPSTAVDMFRIKIWDKDIQEDNIVYDNQMGSGDDEDPTTAIGGGNIKIHTVKAAPPHSRFADHGAALPSSPTRFRLLANYPNPFNPETWLPYELAEDRSVTIRIYSASGRLVRLLDLGHRPAGFYTSREKSAYWDGRNESGESVSSGVYFYQIQAGDFSATRKMTILR